MSEGNNQGDTREKNNSKIIIGSIVGVVLVMALMIFALYPKMSVMVMGHEAYYMKAEKEFFNEEVSLLKKVISINNKAKYNSKSKVWAEVSGIDNMIPGLSELISGYNIELINDVDLANKKQKSEFKFNNSEGELINLLLQKDEKRMGISFPKHSEKQIITPLYEELDRLLLNDPKEVELLTGLNKKEFGRLKKDLFKKVIADSIPKKNINTGKEEYNGVKYSTTTFTIDEKVAVNMQTALLKMLQEDENLRSLILNSYQYFIDKSKDINEVYEMEIEVGLEATELLEELISSLEESIGDIDDYEFDEEDKIDFTVFYDKKGNVAVRRLSVLEEQEVIIGTYKADSEKVFEVVLRDLEQEKDVLNFKCKSKLDNNKLVGSMELQVEARNLLDASYDLDFGEKINGVSVILSDIAIRIPDIPGTVLTIKGSKKDEGIRNEVEIQGYGISAAIISESTLSNAANLDDFHIDETTTLTDDDMESLLSDLMSDISSDSAIQNIMSLFMYLPRS